MTKEIDLTNAPDSELKPLKVENVLGLPAPIRQRWFALQQLMHQELARVLGDMTELMSPHIDTKIISLIGMSGIGKTTLSKQVLALLQTAYGSTNTPSECPVIYVQAPANGERSLSWRVLYHRILDAAGEPCIERKRTIVNNDGYVTARSGKGRNVAEAREFVEQLLKQRKVKALIIDECLHLLRFSEYSAVMDTLKSLADAHPDTKLVLIGTHQIADLMIQYGQVARRSEIIHFKRYKLTSKEGAKQTPDELAYIDQLKKFESIWPCNEVPNLQIAWRHLMAASLGSIGLTKGILDRLLALQLSTPGERLEANHWKKALRAPTPTRQMEQEAQEGEIKLECACYGDGQLSDELYNSRKRA